MRSYVHVWAPKGGGSRRNSGSIEEGGSNGIARSSPGAKQAASEEQAREATGNAFYGRTASKKDFYAVVALCLRLKPCVHCKT